MIDSVGVELGGGLCCVISDMGKRWLSSEGCDGLLGLSGLSVVGVGDVMKVVYCINETRPNSSLR